MTKNRETSTPAGNGGAQSEDTGVAQKLRVDGRVGWLSGWAAAGAYCGQCGKTVYNWHKSGKLPVKKVGPKTVLIRPEDIDRAIITLADEYEAEQMERLANT